MQREKIKNAAELLEDYLVKKKKEEEEEQRKERKQRQLRKSNQRKTKEKNGKNRNERKRVTELPKREMNERVLLGGEEVQSQRVLLYTATELNTAPDGNLLVPNTKNNTK